jgi:hypothetical protein
MDRRVDLDIVGALEGADKSSCVRMGWDYLRHYEAALEDFRERPVNVIEIGVAGGASLRMWKWFFSTAQLVGLDIDPRCAAQAQERVEIVIGSQTDAALLDALCTRCPPSVLIDDGSHLLEHIVFTFQHVFPRLLPGGVYIIEDFFIGADPSVAETELAAPEYFLDVARRCLATVAMKSVRKIPAEISAEVDSVTFVGHAVIIRKKHDRRDVARAQATADAYLGARKLPLSSRDQYAAYLLRHGGSPEAIDAILRQALQAGGPSMARLSMLAENALNQGRTEEADALLKQAAAHSSRNDLVLRDLSRLQEAVGDIAGALHSAGLAAAATPNARNKRLVARLQARLGDVVE